MLTRDERGRVEVMLRPRGKREPGCYTVYSGGRIVGGLVNNRFGWHAHRLIEGELCLAASGAATREKALETLVGAPVAVRVFRGHAAIVGAEARGDA